MAAPLLAPPPHHTTRDRQSGVAPSRTASDSRIARSSKRPPAICRAAFRDQNLFALKRPLSPGVAILNKAACGLGLNLNVPLGNPCRCALAVTNRGSGKRRRAAVGEPHVGPALMLP